MKRLIGICMLIVIFAGPFVAIGFALGWQPVIAAYSIAIGIVVWVVVATNLIFKE